MHRMSHNPSPFSLQLPLSAHINTYLHPTPSSPPVSRSLHQFGPLVRQPKAAIEQLKKERAEEGTTGHIAYKPKGRRFLAEESVLPLKEACQVDIHVPSRASAAAPVLPGKILSKLHLESAAIISKSQQSPMAGLLYGVKTSRDLV